LAKRHVLPPAAAGLKGQRTGVKIRDDFLPLSRPTIEDSDIGEVVKCLKSGWITTGPLCKAFEDQFCALTGAPRAVTFSSGTAAMHLLFLALDLREGDEVITPSMTFASTVNMIALRGARPVFVDVDYDTLNVNADLIEGAVTERTKAIIPVHFAGAPADMDKIMDIARRHDAVVIEDAAHALGTYYKGIHAGGFGQIAVFSFHPLKNITTGEGGMIVLQDESLETRLRLLRFHGIERDAWKRYGKGGNPDYDIKSPGFKYNLTDMQAALGLAQLSRLAEMNARRERLAGLYLEGLRGMDGLDVPGIPDYPHRHSWHLFVVKVQSMKREAFMEKLAEYNIGYGIHFPPTHRLEYVARRYGPFGHVLEATERVGDRLLSLPLFPLMKDEDVLYVCEAIRKILGT
jgi:UDP-4-amino-4-deoxy-L-arabinose-oxoglutarate aminotransferase